MRETLLNQIIVITSRVISTSRHIIVHLGDICYKRTNSNGLRPPTPPFGGPTDVQAAEMRAEHSVRVDLDHEVEVGVLGGAYQALIYWSVWPHHLGAWRGRTTPR